MEEPYQINKGVISGRDDMKFGDFVEGEIVDGELGESKNFKKKIFTRKNVYEHKLNEKKQIDGEKYPMLSSNGKFIPIRRWVHIDLKGGAFKVIFCFNQVISYNNFTDIDRLDVMFIQ